MLAKHSTMSYVPALFFFFFQAGQLFCWAGGWGLGMESRPHTFSEPLAISDSLRHQMRTLEPWIGSSFSANLLHNRLLTPQLFNKNNLLNAYRGKSTDKVNCRRYLFLTLTLLDIAFILMKLSETVTCPTQGSRVTKQQSWIPPKISQFMLHAITADSRDEDFPCLSISVNAQSTS